MANSTPGPWDRVETTVFRLDETETCNRFAAQIQGGYKERGQGWLKDERTSDDELLANARLIAAAPETHEELAWFVDQLDRFGAVTIDSPATKTRLTKARAAIAKARGGEA